MSAAIVASKSIFPAIFRVTTIYMFSDDNLISNPFKIATLKNPRSREESEKNWQNNKDILIAQNVIPNDISEKDWLKFLLNGCMNVTNNIANKLVPVGEEDNTNDETKFGIRNLLVSEMKAKVAISALPD